MKKHINHFLKEIVPIIIGILIALYINNWNENRKVQKYYDQITSSIKTELSETNEDIIKTIDIQKSFIDTLDYYSNDETVSILDIAMKANGIRIPTIKMNSWKSISNSNIELMDFAQVSVFAEIEENKEILKMKAEKLADFTYSNSKATDNDKKEIMRIMMIDIISTENTIRIGINNIINE